MLINKGCRLQQILVARNLTKIACRSGTRSLNFNQMGRGGPNLLINIGSYLTAAAQNTIAQNTFQIHIEYLAASLQTKPGRAGAEYLKNLAKNVSRRKQKIPCSSGAEYLGAE